MLSDGDKNREDGGLAMGGRCVPEYGRGSGDQLRVLYGLATGRENSMFTTLKPERETDRQRVARDVIF
jgi:hypothetical protein